MNQIVGVRFKPAGKIYDFRCGAFVLKAGDPVIVETENGLGFATVARPAAPEATSPEATSPITTPNDAPEPSHPLKKVYRPATEADFAQLQKNAEIEKQAFAFCRGCIRELGLQMHLFLTECNFDASKITFFFTADGRVDFRKLVKLLVKEFRTKIEMRQVGIRNQAKMCGGVGRCGRELCCSSFMTKFDPVSIRMAKNQGLSLNPTKISGVCGRLMCCLIFENEIYEKTDSKQKPKKEPAS
jgi:cell fate regulator YaaT (PSP1 superfamily)